MTTLEAVFVVISALLALAATIVLFILVFPEKKKEKLNKFFLTLRKLLSSEYLLIEKIIRFFYVFNTLFCVIAGLLFIFDFQKSYSYSYYYGGSSSTVWLGWIGPIIMVVGPILMRLIYEASMMFIMLVKNTIDIRNHLIDKDVPDPFKSDITPMKLKKESAPKAAQYPPYPVNRPQEGDSQQYRDRQAYRQSAQNNSPVREPEEDTDEELN